MCRYRHLATPLRGPLKVADTTSFGNPSGHRPFETLRSQPKAVQLRC